MSERKFGMLTILLVLIIVFCMRGTVMSMGNRQRAEENRYYLALEKEYLQNAREFLHGQGLENCGVMMTRMTNEDGSREYMIRIHHRKLKGMDRAGKAELQRELSRREFGKDACTFRYDL